MKEENKNQATNKQNVSDSNIEETNPITDVGTESANDFDLFLDGSGSNNTEKGDGIQNSGEEINSQEGKNNLGSNETTSKTTDLENLNFNVPESAPDDGKKEVAEEDSSVNLENEKVVSKINDTTIESKQNEKIVADNIGIENEQSQINQNLVENDGNMFGNITQDNDSNLKDNSVDVDQNQSNVTGNKMTADEAVNKLLGDNEEEDNKILGINNMVESDQNNNNEKSNISEDISSLGIQNNQNFQTNESIQETNQPIDGIESTQNIQSEQNQVVVPGTANLDQMVQNFSTQETAEPQFNQGKSEVQINQNQEQVQNVEQNMGGSVAMNMVNNNISNDVSLGSMDSTDQQQDELQNETKGKNKNFLWVGLLILFILLGGIVVYVMYPDLVQNLMNKTTEIVSSGEENVVDENLVILSTGSNEEELDEIGLTGSDNGILDTGGVFCGGGNDEVCSGNVLVNTGSQEEFIDTVIQSGENMIDLDGYEEVDENSIIDLSGYNDEISDTNNDDSVFTGEENEEKIETEENEEDVSEELSYEDKLQKYIKIGWDMGTEGLENDNSQLVSYGNLISQEATELLSGLQMSGEVNSVLLDKYFQKFEYLIEKTSSTTTE